MMLELLVFAEYVLRGLRGWRRGGGAGIGPVVDGAGEGFGAEDLWGLFVSEVLWVLESGEGEGGLTIVVSVTSVVMVVIVGRMRWARG